MEIRQTEAEKEILKFYGRVNSKNYVLGKTMDCGKKKKISRQIAEAIAPDEILLYFFNVDLGNMITTGPVLPLVLPQYGVQEMLFTAASIFCRVPGIVKKSKSMNYTNMQSLKKKRYEIQIKGKNGQKLSIPISPGVEPEILMDFLEKMIAIYQN